MAGENFVKLSPEEIRLQAERYAKSLRDSKMHSLLHSERAVTYLAIVNALFKTRGKEITKAELLQSLNDFCETQLLEGEMERLLPPAELKTNPTPALCAYKLKDHLTKQANKPDGYGWIYGEIDPKDQQERYRATEAAIECLEHIEALANPTSSFTQAKSDSIYDGQLQLYSLASDDADEQKEYSLRQIAYHQQRIADIDAGRPVVGEHALKENAKLQIERIESFIPGIRDITADFIQSSRALRSKLSESSASPQSVYEEGVRWYENWERSERGRGFLAALRQQGTEALGERTISGTIAKAARNPRKAEALPELRRLAELQNEMMMELDIPRRAREDWTENLGEIGSARLDPMWNKRLIDEQATLKLLRKLIESGARGKKMLKAIDWPVAERRQPSAFAFLPPAPKSETNPLAMESQPPKDAEEQAAAFFKQAARLGKASPKRAAALLLDSLDETADDAAEVKIQEQLRDRGAFIQDALALQQAFGKPDDPWAAWNWITYDGETRNWLGPCATCTVGDLKKLAKRK